MVLGGRKLGSFFGMGKKAGNLDKVPFYVELGPGVCKSCASSS